MSGFKDLWNRLIDDVKHIFTSGQKAVIDFFEAGVTEFEKQVPVTALAIINAAVGAAETPGLSGAEKRHNAIKAIEDGLKDAGVSLAESLVRLGIELAVQALKAAL